jgi:hypothetical protein
MIRFSAFVAASLLATSAFAAEPAAQSVATLSGQEGTVLVNQGEQFITAADAQALQAGDRVMVMEGGSAILVFNDGCELVLGSGSLATIPAESTCDGAVASVQQIGPSYAQAVGAPRDDDDRNRLAPWIFGAWALGIGYALTEDTKITFPDYPVPPPPVSP